ncbi:HET-domain-containing protein [Xylaria telfairii]|nr:HET-domain-containing protein [Xylaria telfairii]
MHLLNAHTRQLQEFIGDNIPPYAILSHTWGEDEVLFQDLSSPGHKKKLGYKKIRGCCEQAIRDDFDFVWVDTCCIDKRSSAELSEAINSMFRWYGEAKACYVYLADVDWPDNLGEPYSTFRNSKWFTRGWTLQELIAPVNLIFFDKKWKTIFNVDKDQVLIISKTGTDAKVVEEITGIKLWYRYSMQSVDEYKLNKVPVATKLSWASQRHTTRIEDIAYCLLGLLDVNMPLLYGEGHKAFLRLQEEFLKKHHDPTILSWGFGMDCSEIQVNQKALGPGCLASTPSLFRGFRGVDLRQIHDRLNAAPQLGWAVTPRGLHIELPVVQFNARHNVYMGIIGYDYDDQFLAIPLQRYHGLDGYVSIPKGRPLLLDPTKKLFTRDNLKWKTIYLDAHSFTPPPMKSHKLGVDTTMLYKDGFVIDSIYPPAFVFENDCVEWIHDLRPFQEMHLVIILHRKKVDTLYIQVNCPRRKPWDRGQREYSTLFASTPYNKNHTAIQVWDAGRRRRWERRLQYPPDLNWTETTTILDGSRVKHIYSEWLLSPEWESATRRPPTWRSQPYPVCVRISVVGGM